MVRCSRGWCLVADPARLGAEIRARRESIGLTLRELARRADLSPSALSLAERGGPVIGADALVRIADALATDRPTRARWSALGGRIPEDIERAILDVPERWDDLRAWLLVQRVREVSR